MTVGLGQHLGVEHVRHVLHIHLDERQQRLGGLHLGLVEVLEHLQPALGVAPGDADGGRHRQADHAGAGHADPHAVLEQVAADPDADASRILSQQLAAVGRSQGDRHRLGAAKGRHHFTLEQGYEIGPLCFHLWFLWFAMPLGTYCMIGSDPP
ncbi:hypothetical protein D3C79_801540 [compost metagenome]